MFSRDIQLSFDTIETETDFETPSKHIHIHIQYIIYVYVYIYIHRLQKRNSVVFRTAKPMLAMIRIEVILPFLGV